MIIAIVNQHGTPERTVVARNLAVLRARSGRRVCLMTTAAGTDSDWCNDRSSAGVRPWIDTRHVGSRAVETRLVALRPLFNDILIDAGARDTDGCRCVLAASRLVVVPVRGGALDLDLQYRLLARLNGARVLNPGLRVLFVAVSGQAGPDANERAAVLAHVSRVQNATPPSITAWGAAYRMQRHANRPPPPRCRRCTTRSMPRCRRWRIRWKRRWARGMRCGAEGADTVFTRGAPLFAVYLSAIPQREGDGSCGMQRPMIRPRDAKQT
jgi:chromosome partitioning protein